MTRKKINLFLIEDSEIYSVMLHQLLSNTSLFKVYSFNAAEEALKNYFLKPDIIVMDYYLPFLSGRNALETFKRKDAEVPIIVISAQADNKIKRQIIMEGAADVLIKTIQTGKELISAIIRIMAEREIKTKKNRQKKMLLRSFLVAGLLIPFVAIFFFFWFKQ
jgi:FixJ family two-component response regulator